MTLQTPRFWYDNGHLTKDQALVVFWFARQQWLDGLSSCGCSEWLGLNEAEYDAYMRRDELPKPNRRHKTLWSVPETRLPSKGAAVKRPQAEGGRRRGMGEGAARAIESFVADVNARLAGPGRLLGLGGTQEPPGEAGSGHPGPSEAGGRR